MLFVKLSLNWCSVIKHLQLRTNPFLIVYLLENVYSRGNKRGTAGMATKGTMGSSKPYFGSCRCYFRTKNYMHHSFSWHYIHAYALSKYNLSCIWFPWRCTHGIYKTNTCKTYDWGIDITPVSSVFQFELGDGFDSCVCLSDGKANLCHFYIFPFSLK